MATVTQFWTESQDQAWQRYGTTIEWYWGYGDDTYFWSFAVRPWTWNGSASVEAMTAVEHARPPEYITGNDDEVFGQETVLTVRVEQSDPHPPPESVHTGSSLRFTAIKVETP